MDLAAREQADIDCRAPSGAALLRFRHCRQAVCAAKLNLSVTERWHHDEHYYLYYRSRLSPFTTVDFGLLRTNSRGALPILGWDQGEM